MKRRKLLGGMGAAGAALTAGDAAVQAAPPNAVLTAAYDACNPRTAGLEVETELGDAYCATLDPVRDAPATTLASLIAKARVAKKELAVNAEAPAHYAGDEIARSIVNDLLRMGGAA